jgi:hypothetical protein
MKWQPMETAPMDGTRILITFRRWMYRDNSLNKTWVKEAFYDMRDGCWTTASGYSLIGDLEQPTAWMPLPDPP